MYDSLELLVWEKMELILDPTGFVLFFKWSQILYLLLLDLVSYKFLLAYMVLSLHNKLYLLAMQIWSRRI